MKNIFWFLKFFPSNFDYIQNISNVYFSGVAPIRLTDTVLPTHAILGEDLILQCSYDMEGDKLYSVKWYRNGKEFYRHIPSDNPTTAVFRQPGLYVDVSDN